MAILKIEAASGLQGVSIPEDHEPVPLTFHLGSLTHPENIIGWGAVPNQGEVLGEPEQDEGKCRS